MDDFIMKITVPRFVETEKVAEKVAENEEVVTGGSAETDQELLKNCKQKPDRKVKS